MAVVLMRCMSCENAGLPNSHMSDNPWANCPRCGARLTVVVRMPPPSSPSPA